MTTDTKTPDARLASALAGLDCNILFVIHSLRLTVCSFEVKRWRRRTIDRRVMSSGSSLHQRSDSSGSRELQFAGLTLDLADISVSRLKQLLFPQVNFGSDPVYFFCNDRKVLQ